MARTRSAAKAQNAGQYEAAVGTYLSPDKRKTRSPPGRKVRKAKGKKGGGARKRGGAKKNLFGKKRGTGRVTVRAHTRQRPSR